MKENNNNKESERGQVNDVVVGGDKEATEQVNGAGRLEGFLWGEELKEEVIEALSEVIGDDVRAEQFFKDWGKAAGPDAIRGWLAICREVDPDKPYLYLKGLAKNRAVYENGKKGGEAISPEERARRYEEEQAELRQRLEAGVKKAREYYAPTEAVRPEAPPVSDEEAVAGFHTMKALLAKSLGKPA